MVDPEFVKATGGDEVTGSIAAKVTCPDKTVAKRAFWHHLLGKLFDV